MAEPPKVAAKFPSGLYEIRSVAAKGNPLTGGGHHDPTSQPVRVDAAFHTWNIERVPGDEFDGRRLSLLSPYPYTGIEDDTVIVTQRRQDDRIWYIWRWKDEEELYTIASLPIWPTPSWTLSSQEPNAEIKIGLWELEPTREQLFKIVPVEPK